MKTLIDKIIDDVNQELKKMDVDEYMRYSGPFSWMIKILKFYKIEEERLIVESFSDGQNCPKSIQSPGDYYDKKYNKK